MPNSYVTLGIFWVNRSESQSAAETSVSKKHATNRFGLLIMREEVGINGCSNMGSELERVCGWEEQLSRLMRADNSVFIPGVNSRSEKQTGEFMTAKQRRTKNVLCCSFRR